MADETPATYPPAATYPEPVEHCDVCRWAAECVAAPPRRRPPEPRRRDHRPGSGARSTDRGVATLEALGDLPLPMDPPLEGIERRRARARPRAGPDPGRGATDRRARATSCSLPERGRARSSRSAGWPRCPPPSPGDLFFDIEGDPFALDDGLDYLFGVLETGRHVPRLLVARRRRRVHASTASGGPSSGSIDFFDRPARARPGPARLPLRAVRADRAQAADGPLRHARGRGRPTCSARACSSTCSASCARRCAPRSRATRSSSWSRSTASSARSTCATPAASIVAFEQWLELGEGERPAADHLERIERYNRDDVVSNLRLRDWLEDRRGRAGRAARAPRSRARTAREVELPDRADRGAGPVAGPRRAARRPRRIAGRPGRPRRPSSRPAGCSPSSSAGTGARTRRCGGSSTGSWT